MTTTGRARTDLQIRTATESDRSALYELLFASWMTSWAPHCPPEAVERFRQTDPCAQYLAFALPDLIVAYDGLGLVGMLHLDGDHLAALHVSPTRKRQGIGAASMDYAEARGATRLDVRDFNKNAIAFYESRGWACVRTYDDTEMGTPAVTHEYRRSPLFASAALP